MSKIQPPYKSKLHEMVCTTPTDFWNDSCSIEELRFAIDHGAVGATSNPVIVGYVLKKESSIWEPRIKQIIAENSGSTEIEMVWKLVEEMAQKSAELLHPVFEQYKKRKGRLSIQTNPQYWPDHEAMWRQAVHFKEIAPNIQVKMPVTAAGVKAIEEATYHGVNINATICFSVSQAIAVAEAIERGLREREAEGNDASDMTPVCTIMVGRQDDWLKAIAKRDNLTVDKDALEWAGVAVMKKAYQIFKQRKYHTRLLAAAYRNLYHWSEFIGADMVLTITNEWQKKCIESNIEVKPRMDIPVNPKYIKELETKFPLEWKKAYEEKGMTEVEFDSYGPTLRTLRSFLQGYDELIQFVRNRMVPDLDVKK